MSEQLNIEQYRNDLTVPTPSPVAVYSSYGSPIATLGTIMTITGEIAAYNSMLAQLLAAHHLTRQLQMSDSPWLGKLRPRIEAPTLPDQRRGVLYLDTEQSDHLVSQTHRRIALQAGMCLDANTDTLRVYGLRDLDMKTQIDVIETAIADYAERCPVVVIDGIHDLFVNITHLDESEEAFDRLRGLAVQHQCLIICLLHGEYHTDDTSIRGRLISDLKYQSKTVIHVASKCELLNQQELVPAIIKFYHPVANGAKESMTMYTAKQEMILPNGTPLRVFQYPF